MQDLVARQLFHVYLGFLIPFINLMGRNWRLASQQRLHAFLGMVSLNLAHGQQRAKGIEEVWFNAGPWEVRLQPLHRTNVADIGRKVGTIGIYPSYASNRNGCMQLEGEDNQVVWLDPVNEGLELAHAAADC